MKNLVGLLFMVVVVLTACNQEKFDAPQAIQTETLTTKSAQIVLNDMTSEQAVSEVEYESDFYFRVSGVLSQQFLGRQKWGWHSGLRYKMGQCPTVSIDSEDTGYPKTITLDYGDSTVLRNGVVLSGMIEIYISTTPNTDGFEKTVSFDNFGVDSVSISGEMSIIYIGDNQTSSIHTTSSNLTITLPDGSVVTRSGERVREWLSGLDTPLDQSDDTIQVTGYAQITTDTTSYKMEVSIPLIKVGDCRHFISGVIDYSTNGTVFALVDYGDGTCDELAYLTQNGETVEINLSGQSPKMQNHHGSMGSNGNQGMNGQQQGSTNQQGQGQMGNGMSNGQQGQQQNNMGGQQGNQGQMGNGGNRMGRGGNNG